MRQSSIIFAALFIGFIIFVTMRGELPAYLQTLGLKSGSSTSSSSTTSSILSGAESVLG